MSAIADSLGPIGKSGRAMLALAPGQAPRTTGRLVTAEQLMAPRCGIVLPRVDHIPVEHRFVSDDRELIRLAEILTDANVAAADDWSEGKRDPTKYVMLALQRWLRDHGAVAVDRRFDLEVVLSDRLVGYSDERGEKGTLYLIVDPWNPRDIQDQTIQKKVLAHMQAAERGFRRAEAAREKAGSGALDGILGSRKLRSLDQVDNLKTLQEIVVALEVAVQNSVT